MTYPNANCILDLSPEALASAAQRVATRYLEVDGCWTWLGHKTSVGYGQFKFERVHYAAHRVTFELENGRIPPGLVLDHLCRNRACVNPAHLEAVTQHVNLVRGKTGQNNAAKTHCPYGHEYTPDNTYVIPKSGGRTCRTCGAARCRTYAARQRAG